MNKGTANGNGDKQKAVLIAAKSDAYVVPGLIAVGMVAGTIMAIVGTSTVQTIGAGVVGSAVSGLIGAKHSGEAKGDSTPVDEMGAGPEPTPPPPTPPPKPEPPTPPESPKEPSKPIEIYQPAFPVIEQHGTEELPRNEMGLPIRPAKPIPIHHVPDPLDEVGFLDPSPTPEAIARGIAAMMDSTSTPDPEAIARGIAAMMDSANSPDPETIARGIAAMMDSANSLNRNLDGLAGPIFRLDDEGRELGAWG